MSIEIYVLSDGSLTSVGGWQAAIDREAFDLRLDADADIGSLDGFLPARLNDVRTGFEFCRGDSHALAETYPNVVFGRHWPCVQVFRCIGDFKELLAAWMAASAYAKVSGGVVFDPQGGQILAPEQALNETRKIEAQLPAYEQAVREIETRLSRPRDSL